jgi:ubiquinone/menaquinone biosynthesis C-methylase UbiE
MNKYVHGYSERESQRLEEQSEILEKLLHEGTLYKPYEHILEAGCGVGAQTVIMAKRNPDCFITSIDISHDSLAKAQAKVKSEGFNNVAFQQADIHDIKFEPNSFDHVFVCFVLEHLSNPNEALLQLKKVLKPGGTITVIEGDHEACIWNPSTNASKLTWQAMIKSQQMLGHDPNIGRRLYPILEKAGFSIEFAEPRWIYTDGNNPKLADGMVNKIIVPMVKTAHDFAIKNSLIDEITFQQGIVDLENSAVAPEGTFFYTWFKAVGKKF